MSNLMPIGDALVDAEVFTDGDWVESKDQDPDGDVRLTQLADVGDGNWLNKSARFLTSEKANELRCTYLKKGDLLVARMPQPLGRCCVFPGDPMPCVTVVDVCVIRSNHQKIDNRYLMHVINSPHGRQGIVRYTTGTTRQRISRKNLGKVAIPLPPLDEQRRIATILDAADALRAKRREALVQLDTLLQSTFVDMFGDPVTNPMGWNECTVGDVTDCIVPGRDKPKSFTGSTPWITTNDLVGLGVTTHSPKDIGLSSEEINEVRARVIPKKSVIISCVGDLGISSIAGRDLVVNQQLHTFQCGDRVNCHFLAFFLPFRKPWMRRRATQTTLPYLNKTNCNSIPVFVPPLDLQRHFATIVKSVERQRTTQRAHLAELDTLFAALQSRAFRGDL